MSTRTREAVSFKIKAAALLILIAGLATATTGCKVYTVVKNGQQAGGSGSPSSTNDSSFDPDGYVNNLWNSEIIPYMKSNAKALPEVLKAVKEDPEKAGGKYGFRNASSGSAWSFIVKGSGKVLKVNAESRAGFMELDLAPYDGQVDIKLSIGPVFKGAAIRDSLAFINFDEFKNQIQYAQLANALNKKALDTAVATAKTDTMANQEISFIGAFTADGTDISVVPVQLGQGKEGN